MPRMHLVCHQSAAVWQGDLMIWAFRAIFDKLGFDVRTHIGESPDPKKSTKDDWYFLLDFLAFDLMGKGWRRCPQGPVIFYNVTRYGDTESSERQWAKHWNRWTRAYNGRFDVIFDYDPNNCRPGLSRPKPHYPCPIGYHPVFEIRDKGLPVKYDAGFLGWVYPGGRRDQALQALEGDFSVAVCTRFQHGRHANRDPLRHINHQRNLDVMRCRVFLNIQTDGKNLTLPSPRVILLGFSNELCVLSELASWLPWGVRDCCVVVSLEGFSGALKTLCRYPNLCRRIAREAYDWARTEWRLDVHVKRALRDAGLT